MERFIHWSRELESLYLHKTIRDAYQHSDALKITMRAILPERSTKREVKVLFWIAALQEMKTPQLNVKEGINSRLLFCIDVYCDVYRSTTLPVDRGGATLASCHARLKSISYSLYHRA
ncbi:hypothetical protein JG688_00001257 [Phytophthora aleatoria]|uniref:Uncharacterized protein n=1 Tax=Phytophthora aleatoria TaxID=2496075 RepID=A0A8J5M9N0_9STRA|nr:hypothetical protein JG688_00001257 [Phytophthora aleatoria]